MPRPRTALSRFRRSGGATSNRYKNQAARVETLKVVPCSSGPDAVLPFVVSRPGVPAVNKGAMKVVSLPVPLTFVAAPAAAAIRCEAPASRAAAPEQRHGTRVGLQKAAAAHAGGSK